MSRSWTLITIININIIIITICWSQVSVATKI